VQAARSTGFACILLDVMLPRIDGFETCSRLRGLGRARPDRDAHGTRQEIDKVRGLELGADDYVTKPFGLRELIARIRAVIRRSDAAPPPPAEEVQIGAALIHFASGRVVRGRGGNSRSGTTSARS
jgi:DNA-binding response OmpR family regulator